MNMKKLIVSAFICLFPVSVFAIAGFGLNVAYDQVIVNAGSDSKVSSITEVRILRNGFENGAGVGGFLYLDVIPYIDLEVDFQFVGNTYQFDFQNYLDSNVDGAFDDDEMVVNTGSTDFLWARASVYYTVRTNLLDLSIPVLGGVDLHAGAGMNQHIAAPFMSLSLMESLLGEDLFEEFDEEAMAKKILDYMEENSETVQGFHVQAGLQFKILVLTALLNVRYTIVEDLYPDISAFPSINLNIGLGI